MIKCCICGATPKSGCQLSFHKFPTNAAKRMEWLHSCFLTEPELKLSYMKVCSRHFQDCDYDSTLWPRKVLLKTSIPKVIYPYLPNTSNQKAGPSSQPQDLIQTKPQDIVVDKAVAEQLVPEEHSQQELVAKQPVNYIPKGCRRRPSFDARFIRELQTTYFSTPRKAKRNLELIKGIVENQSKKIRLLFKQKKRLERRINSLKELLETLSDNKLLNEDAVNSTIIIKNNNKFISTPFAIYREMD